MLKYKVISCYPDELAERLNMWADTMSHTIYSVVSMVQSESASPSAYSAGRHVTLTICYYQGKNA